MVSPILCILQAKKRLGQEVISEKLYFNDAYSTRFGATVISNLTVDNMPALILDRTFFYPNSGGQPNDTGTINNSPVLDVFIREDDGLIVHVLADAIDSDSITAEIDWTRRFDHMQQHSGQHILSRAFIESASANTISFHLGKSISTIDLDKPDLSSEQIEMTESLANQVVWSNRKITSQVGSDSELRELDVKSRPDLEPNQIRMINIESFDLTPCGGTHVANSGEIGLIKVIRQENFKGGTRISFVCGSRALSDYRMKKELLDQLSGHFTTSVDKISDSILKLQSESKDNQRQAKKLRNQLSSLEAERYLKQGTKVGSVNVITEIFSDRFPEEVRAVANKLIKEPETIVLFAIDRPGLQFIFCRSEDTAVNMDHLLKLVADGFDSTKGGGSDSFAQARGPAAHPSRINRALMEAQQYLVEMLR